jgi:hypothetical protein
MVSLSFAGEFDGQIDVSAISWISSSEGVLALIVSNRKHSQTSSQSFSV